MRSKVFTASALLLAAPALLPATGVAAEYRAERHVQRASPATKLVPAKRAGEPAAAVKLHAPTGAELASLKDKSRAPRIGFARELPPLADDNMLARLQWQELPGGARISSFAVTSPDAAGLRIGLAPKTLPLRALFRFHDGSGRAAVEVSGEDILESIANNLEAREDGAGARTWWSPVIEASTLVVEVELPAGSRPADIRMAAPTVSHLVSSAARGFAPPKAEGACAIDAKCHENMWSQEMNAEARVVFTRDGVTYACSGTLLADQDAATEIPYFHTASHCISTQAEASTVATYWFHRSSSCGSGTASRYEVRNGGATLLHTHPDTDTTLLRLNSAPPAGAVFMGWKAGEAPRSGTAVTGIHHGGTGVQRISFGDIEGLASCLRGGDMCRFDSSPDGAFYYVTWRAGTTLGGGSGSPLVADNSRYLVGHLSNGMSSCTRAGAGDFYGRFDVAYHAGLHRFLGAAAAAVNTPTPVPPAPRLDAGPRLRLTTTLSSVPRYAEK